MGRGRRGCGRRIHLSDEDAQFRAESLGPQGAQSGPAAGTWNRILSRDKISYRITNVGTLFESRFCEVGLEVGPTTIARNTKRAGHGPYVELLGAL